jgi:hypothetical protein
MAGSLLYSKGNKPRYLLAGTLGGAQSYCRHFEEERNLCPLPGIEPRSWSLCGLHCHGSSTIATCSQNDACGFYKINKEVQWLQQLLTTALNITELWKLTQNCEKRLLVLSYLPVCLSVLLSAWNKSAPARRIFMKLCFWVFFENLSRKFKFN